ncbi:uncharacterized protein V6R79_015069 [Siganus canaliculatus]
MWILIRSDVDPRQVRSSSGLKWILIRSDVDPHQVRSSSGLKWILIRSDVDPRQEQVHGLTGADESSSSLEATQSDQSDPLWGHAAERVHWTLHCGPCTVDSLDPALWTLTRSLGKHQRFLRHLFRCTTTKRLNYTDLNELTAAAVWGTGR